MMESGVEGLSICTLNPGRPVLLDQDPQSVTGSRGHSKDEKAAGGEVEDGCAEARAIDVRSNCRMVWNCIESGMHHGRSFKGVINGQRAWGYRSHQFSFLQTDRRLFAA